MKILKVSPKKINLALKIAAKLIKQNKVLIFPTDTVYGLVGNAASWGAVGKLLKIKKRPKDKSLPVFIKNIKEAKKLAKIGKEQEKFLRKHWPGKVTVVLDRNKKVKIFGVARETIALRIPDYRLLNLLLEKTELPIIGTSANVSGKPDSTKIKQIIKQFKNQKYQPDLIIDVGNLKKSKTSTVVDFTGAKIKILRKGAIKINEKS